MTMDKKTNGPLQSGNDLVPCLRLHDRKRRRRQNGTLRGYGLPGREGIHQLEDRESVPSIETIAEKSGISRRQVINSLATLSENGYIDKTKVGRKNSYTLREKITLKDQEGRPAAFATWDYLPSTVEAARAELKRFMLTGEYDGKVLYVENLNLSVQINQGDGNLNWQGKMDPAVEAALARLKATWDKAKEKKKRAKP